MSLYLGVDLGTSAVKVLVFDAESCQVVARGQAAVAAPRSPRPGAAEQDPADWWRAFSAAMDQVLAADGLDRRAIRALGVSGQQHGMVVVDRERRVLRAAKLWCDVEAHAEAPEISALVGYPVPAGFTAPKLLWFLRHEAELARRVAHLLLPHDWLNLQLTGEIATDHGDASGTGLYDPLAADYLHAQAAQLHPDLPQWLAPLRGPCQAHGQLLPAIAARFSLPVDLPVSIGSGDNMMSALGAGATEPGTWVLSLGTSGTIFGTTEQPLLDPSGAIAPFRSALGSGLPLVCIQNCAGVLEEARAASGQSHDSLTADAAALPWAEDDPLFLPYLSGERFPNLPQARGLLSGLRPGDLQPARLYRAAVEGVSLALAHGLGALRQHGLEVDSLRLVGGAARNPLLVHLICQLTGCQTQALTEVDTAALGAAMQACWIAQGTHPRELKPTEASPRLTPDPATAKFHQARRSRYLELVETVLEQP